MTFQRLLSRLAFWRGPAPDCGCPETPTADPSVTAALTALGAKLARADGHIAPEEFDRFVEAFPPHPQAHRDVHRLYGLAGETTLGFEGYARRIGKRYSACPELLERVMDGLFEVAKADGAVTTDELAYLERVANLAGVPPLAFRRIRNEHLGAAPDDPYRVLGVPADASDETVRSAWKRALVGVHPDKEAGLGGSPERVAAAEQAASALNAAYDAVMRERRALASAA